MNKLAMMFAQANDAADYVRRCLDRLAELLRRVDSHKMQQVIEKIDETSQQQKMIYLLANGWCRLVPTVASALAYSRMGVFVVSALRIEMSPRNGRATAQQGGCTGCRGDWFALPPFAVWDC